MSRPEDLLQRRAFAADRIGSVLLGLGATFLLLSAVGGVALWNDLEDTSLSTADKLAVLLGPVVSALVLSLVSAGAGAAMRLMSAYTVARSGPAPKRAPVVRPQWSDVVIGVSGAVLLLGVLAAIFLWRG